MHRPTRPEEEAHRLLDRLTAPEAPATAPSWDEERAAVPHARRRWPWLLAPVLAVAAGALLLVNPPEQDPAPGLRGHGDQAWVEVDLRLVAIQDGQARRAISGDTLQVGDQVLLRVGATPASELTLWVDTPTGTEQLATMQAGTEPTEVEVGDQLLAWSFDRPGAHAIYASAHGPGSCPQSACARIELNVELAEVPDTKGSTP